MGDRECPECGEITLIEKDLTVWKCLKCGKEFKEEYLDEGIE